MSVSTPRIVSASCTADLSLPLPRPWSSVLTEFRLIVTEVRTEDGVCGTGVSWIPQTGADAVRAMLESDVYPTVVGWTSSPEASWDLLWRHLHEAGRGGVTTLAMAGIDIALWDLRARRAGLPLVELIGRRRNTAEVYGSGVNLHYSLDELQSQAQRWVDNGHRSVKIKVGHPDLAVDVGRVRAVREIIGPNRRLMIDANQRWNLTQARRGIDALEQFDLYWVEEPIHSEDIQGYARLRSRTSVPIACGENIHTVTGFRDLLVAGACDVVQPNVARLGGITPFLRVTTLATAFGVEIAPHLLPELSGQLALCLPDESMVEDVEDTTFARLGALASPSGIAIDRGQFTAHTGPGHGLTFRTSPSDYPKEST
jgi:L-alanine-DL-glutamate epimerase-like enolase superfamily enzyme